MKYRKYWHKTEPLGWGGILIGPWEVMLCPMSFKIGVERFSERCIEAQLGPIIVQYWSPSVATQLPDKEGK